MANEGKRARHNSDKRWRAKLVTREAWSLTTTTTTTSTLLSGPSQCYIGTKSESRNRQLHCKHYDYLCSIRPPQAPAIFVTTVIIITPWKSLSSAGALLEGWCWSKSTSSKMGLKGYRRLLLGGHSDQTEAGWKAREGLGKACMERCAYILPRRASRR